LDIATLVNTKDLLVRIVQVDFKLGASSISKSYSSMKKVGLTIVRISKK
jgi:hypothetical protein